MGEPRITSRTVVRYILLQIPALGAVVLGLLLVGRWLPVPRWLFWCIVVGWVVKDTVLFFFTWQAYDWGRVDDSVGLVGARGTVSEDLDPRGMVLVRGELWQAVGEDGAGVVPSGTAVTVAEVRGMIAVVRPCDEADDGP